MPEALSADQLASPSAAFSRLTDGLCVVLGPGFLSGGSGYRALSIEHSAMLSHDEFDQTVSQVDAGPSLLALPFEAGRWFEPTANAASGPWWKGSEVASLDHSPKGKWLKLRELQAERAVPSDLPSASFEADLDDAARHRYTDAVRGAVELIRAGDVFQVNLAHPIRARLMGRPRVIGQRLANALDAAFFAYVELDEDRVAICCSPERFLDVEPIGQRRMVRTDPIKGTRRATEDDTADLEAAEKDRAELAMIVDLMRNDLGRVAVRGSVRVSDPRRLELHHGRGIAHAVSTVEGELRTDASLADCLAATFPPGSVTGAPKVRALQIIDELEPKPRGLYCGTFAFMESGHMRSSVNIRTLVLDRVRPECWDVTLWVGAGIVADSNPDAEWEETLVKAHPILDALDSGRTI